MNLTTTRTKRLIIVSDETGRQLAVACSGPGGCYLDLFIPGRPATSGLTHLAFQPDVIERTVRDMLAKAVP